MAVVPIDFIGYAPDLDPSTPGIFRESQNVYPTPRGFRTMPSLVEAYPALPTRVSPADNGDCYGVFMGRYLDGTGKLIAGSKTALYHGQNGSWTAVNGSDYATDDRDMWRFAMFGDDMIAVNGSNQPQVLPAAGSTFVDLAGTPPVAKIVAAANGFVFLLNLVDHATETVDAVTWWCSGINDDTAWDPDIATQAANGRLLETEGEIIGAYPLGRNLVVYKKKSVYLFEYVGPPRIWTARLLSNEIGAVSHEGILNMGDRHVFVGYDNFYIIDGAGPPRPLESPLRRFLFELGDLNRNYDFAVKARWDRALAACFFHYPSRAIQDESVPQKCDKWVCWSPFTNRWTAGAEDITMVVYPEVFSSVGLTYGGFAGVFGTYGGITVPYNSFIFSGSTDVLSGVIKDANQKLYLYSGVPDGTGYIKTGDLGDGQSYYIVRRLRPRFAAFPSSLGMSVLGYHKEALGKTDTQVTTAFLDQDTGWLDLIQTGRYNNWRFNLGGGDSELIGFDIDQDVFGYR